MPQLDKVFHWKNVLENECSQNTEWVNLQSSEVVSLKILLQKANEN